MTDRPIRRARWLTWILGGAAALFVVSLILVVTTSAEAPGPRVAAPAPRPPQKMPRGSMVTPADPIASLDGIGYARSTLEIEGRNTWYFWTAGNERFYRRVAVMSAGHFDLLKVVDSRLNGQRFQQLGLMSDPSCVPAEAPDQYGLWLDQCAPEGLPGIPGRASGVVGLRIFDNPSFDRASWSVERYLEHPKNAEPPYLVGMTCGFCHIGLDPLHPAIDPERPAWRNLAPTIGNQYLEDAKLFSMTMTPDDFRWHVANKQLAGTVDTSRFATDHISNPNAINTIFNLPFRPAVAEKMRDGSLVPVHHILKDGADSIGIAGASLRVYVNLGMCSDYWLTRHDAVYGMTPQKPFSIDTARQECPEWRETEARMPAAAAFLKTIRSMPLKDAPGGAAYLSAAPALVERGKVVFAERCAACHSSKQPPASIADAAARAHWFRESVLSRDFLDGNFLSDDKRHPVTEIGTNMARALASNAIAGEVWEEFSSETYKALPSAGTVTGLYNPLNPGSPIDFTLPGGGRGYYRTPSLASIWATAPFLHNNSVGVFTKDPSVHGRMAAFMDGIEKLLWPERRLGLQSIPVTTTPSWVRLSSGPTMEVPVNTAINVIARVDPRELPRLGQRWLNLITRTLGIRFLLNQILSKNLAPDFIEDHGHTYGASLSDEDKRALIEFLKTL
jgi:hypothetical protein